MFESIGPWIAEDLARRAGISRSVAAILAPLGMLALAYLAGVLIERGMRAMLSRASASKTRVDDLVARALHGPTRVLAVLYGLGFAVLVIDLPAAAHHWTRVLLGILVGVSIVVVAARLVGGFVELYGATARLEGPARRVARRVTTLAIWSLGLLLVAQSQGINVTPLLTTLGLAGLAVALAFQDTLSNLFAGVYIQADRPLEVGHYVRLEEHKLEGYVVEVGWRTSKIRTLGNNLIVIPNARLANTIVTDYDLPEPHMSLLVNVVAARGTDPRELVRILEDEAAIASKEVPGMLAEPAPFVRVIPGFTESGLEVTVISQVRTFVDQYLAQDELRRRIDARLKREGIELGSPRRIVEVQERAQRSGAGSADAAGDHARRLS